MMSCLATFTIEQLSSLSSIGKQIDVFQSRWHDGGHQITLNHTFYKYKFE